MKSAIVLLVGRPNVGKSTLVNAIVGHKVSITSPKPQTTRFSIQAVYEDERGQLLLTDTPGIFMKAHDPISRLVNKRTVATLQEEADVVVYVVDRSRARSFEEGRVLGLVRALKKPTILVINKTDKEPDHGAEYRFLEDEVTHVLSMSAKEEKDIRPLIDLLFTYAKRDYPLVDRDSLVTPAVNITSRIYLQEIIREKIYLAMRQEVPYHISVFVDHIKERKNGTLYIHAFLYTSDSRYKKILIGKEGRMLNEIGRSVRHELETVTQKKIYLDLRVETNVTAQQSQD